MQVGIWRWADYYPWVEPEFRLTLEEGNTPYLEVGGIIFKREDKNPTGSVKDRGLAYQVSDALKKGQEKLIISSSGNAAISAAAYCQLANIHLRAFLPQKIDREKLKRVKFYQAETILTRRPVSDAVKTSRAEGIRNLRPSTDEMAVEGFKSIALELNEKVGDFEAIFIPVSSGTTLVGICRAFDFLGKLPQIHAVQTTAVHPVASLFDREFTATKSSLAKALVARYTVRRGEIVGYIERSRGFGWVVSDQKIEKALAWLSQHGISTSAEGGAALAGLWKAKKKGFKFERPVCLLTGQAL